MASHRLPGREVDLPNPAGADHPAGIGRGDTGAGQDHDVLAAVAYQFGQPLGALGGGLPSAGGEHPADAELEQHVQRRELVLDQVERSVEDDRSTAGGIRQPGRHVPVDLAGRGQRAHHHRGRPGAERAPDVGHHRRDFAAVVTEVTLPGADQDVHRERADADHRLLQAAAGREPAGLQRRAQFDPVGATVPGRPGSDWRSRRRPR